MTQQSNQIFNRDDGGFWTATMAHTVVTRVELPVRSSTT